MDTQALRNAYDEFHTTAAMSHAAPADGGGPRRAARFLYFADSRAASSTG